MSADSDEVLAAHLAARAAEREARPLRAVLELLFRMALRVVALMVGIPLYLAMLSVAIGRFGAGPVTAAAWVAVIGSTAGLVAIQLTGRQPRNRGGSFALPGEVRFSRWLLGPVAISERRVRLGALVLIGVAETVLVGTLLLYFLGAPVGIVEDPVGLAVGTSLFVPPTVIVLAALHERGPPETGAGWLLGLCGWVVAVFLSVMVGLLTGFLVPTLLGAALTLLLPIYILGRIRMTRGP